jgi:AcrR family transcriptional regulator
MRTVESRRQRSRRGEGEKLREEILAAAERLLIERGDESAVSIRAIADAVGVTPPAIYLHFADKNELIFAICEKHFQALHEVTANAIADVDSPVEALRAAGRAYVRFGLEHPEQYRILFMTNVGETAARFTPEELMDVACFGLVMSCVQRGIDAGVFAGDALDLAIVLWTSVHGLTSLLICKTNFPWPDREELIERCVENACRGMMTGV